MAQAAHQELDGLDRRTATPPTTIEAMMFSLRRGAACLNDTATRERLGRCDAAAIEQIAIRLRTWKSKNVPWLPAYTDDDIATLLRVWRALRGRA
jgi:hypothetical protein